MIRNKYHAGIFATFTDHAPTVMFSIQANAPVPEYLREWSGPREIRVRN